MKAGNRRLCYDDRKKIERLASKGVRVSDIADAVGVHRQTIYNELKRGGDPYDADTAQKSIR